MSKAKKKSRSTRRGQAQAPAAVRRERRSKRFSSAEREPIWTISGLAMCVETRVCDNCKASFECPPTSLMVTAKAHGGRIKRARKPIGDLAGEIAQGHPIERIDVRTEIPLCHLCTTSRNGTQLDFLAPHQLPNVPRQFRGDTLLSGTEEPKPKPESNVVVPSLEDF